VFPVSDNQKREAIPVVTYTLVALNVIVYLWDRHWGLTGGLTGPNVVFADLTMQPREVMNALRGSGDIFPLITIFTSMFMHGSIMHIVGNMMFLLVFGPGIEHALGASRFALYYILWGVIAAFSQIYVNPNSSVPTLGASGAIGGVLGAYFLLFPTNKIEVLFFFAISVSAWVLLGVWFLWQIIIPQEGVANWAHAGGFLAGMLTVLLLGGRKTILKGREDEFDFA
jgi:membrane associated rhomboid family serine protease